MTIEMRRESIKISYIAVFSGLALLTSISGLSSIFIYPPVPYLKFDPAEIFDMMAYFIGGFEIAILTTLIHFIGLTLLGGDIIGPGMKFLAVLSMLSGFHLAERLGATYIIKFGVSTVFRVFIMSLANIYVLVIMAPGFLEVFKIYNTLFFIELDGLGLLAIALILTGVYNVLHNIFTIATSHIASNYINKMFKVQL